MKFSSSVLLAAALGGASARPSGHHAHQNAHRSLENRDFVMAVKPAPEPTTAPPPAPTTTKEPEKPKPTEVVAAANSKESSGDLDFDLDIDLGIDIGGGGDGPSKFTPFCGGQKSKRATLDQIMYAGNIGTPGNYGCNMMLVNEDIADEYDYNVKLQNAGSKEQQCVAYLKIGPDGGINGFFKGNEALSFKLPAKGTQYLAVDENTQGGVICQAGEIETTSYGEYASTWLEFDMANESNQGWSGADASCLTASRQNMEIPGLKVCGSGTCSTINPGGTGDNAFLKGMEAEDGWGLNLPAGKVRMEVTVDYSG